MASLSNKERLEIVQKLLEDVPAKTLAYLYETSIFTIYQIRDKFLTQKWVLKRHPKDKFNLGD